MAMGRVAARSRSAGASASQSSCSRKVHSWSVFGTALPAAQGHDPALDSGPGEAGAQPPSGTTAQLERVHASGQLALVQLSRRVTGPGWPARLMLNTRPAWGTWAWCVHQLGADQTGERVMHSDSKSSFGGKP